MFLGNLFDGLRKVGFGLAQGLRTGDLGAGLLDHLVGLLNGLLHRLVERLCVLFRHQSGLLVHEAKAWPFKGLGVGRCQPMVLKEELPIRRRATSETVEVPVTLRKQRTVVERIDPDEPRMSLRAPIFIVHVGSVARCPGGGRGAGCRGP